MAEIELKNGEWGEFTNQVLSAMQIRVNFHHIEQNKFPQVAEWFNWAIISDMYWGEEYPTCEQLVMTNGGSKRNLVSSIRIRNMTEFEEKALDIQIFYTDQKTGAKRVYYITQWDEEHIGFGSQIMLGDTEKDGLEENYPYTLQMFAERMRRGKPIGTSLRQLIDECYSQRL